MGSGVITCTRDGFFCGGFDLALLVQRCAVLPSALGPEAASDDSVRSQKALELSCGGESSPIRLDHHDCGFFEDVGWTGVHKFHHSFVVKVATRDDVPVG